MSKLTPLKPIEVVRKMKKFGFHGPFAGGRHVHMVNKEKKLIIPIPYHQGKDIGVGLISTILKEANISREQWLSV